MIYTHYLYMVYLDGDGAVDGEWGEGGQRRDEDGRATHRAHQQRVADLHIIHKRYNER